jgi:hypothetical protein
VPTRRRQLYRPTHFHRPIDELRQTHQSRACVAPTTCNPKAHGGSWIIEFCRCGASRYTNVRGYAMEYGRWELQ